MRRRQWRWYRHKTRVRAATERVLYVVQAALARREYFEITHGDELGAKALEFNEVMGPVHDVLRQYQTTHQPGEWVEQVDEYLEEFLGLDMLDSQAVTRRMYYRLVPKHYVWLERVYYALRVLGGEWVPEKFRVTRRV